MSGSKMDRRYPNLEITGLRKTINGLVTQIKLLENKSKENSDKLEDHMKEESGKFAEMMKVVEGNTVSVNSLAESVKTVVAL